MDPLSIYWNSVWRDAQRRRRDPNEPKAAVTRPPTLFRRIARYPKAAAAVGVLALASATAIFSAA